MLSYILTSAALLAGVAANNNLTYPANTTSIAPSVTPTLSTVIFYSCTETDTATATLTDCPKCSETFTTTYTTAYVSVCPTGTTMETYTITETCTGNSETYTPPATPTGFTTTETVCTVCEGKPTVTITCPVSSAPVVNPPAATTLTPQPAVSSLVAPVAPVAPSNGTVSTPTVSVPSAQITGPLLSNNAGRGYAGGVITASLILVIAAVMAAL